MTDDAESSASVNPFVTFLQKHYDIMILVLLLCAGAYLRFYGLGARSLWLDEFSTWHVSQLPVWQSLQWGPELTKPPLYQFILRFITDEPYPPEWLLRLPAAVAGIVTICASWWLGKIAGGRHVAIALAALITVNLMQLDYSQEVRPYTLLTLGATISIAIWYRLVQYPTKKKLFCHVLVTTLMFYSHYLALLTIAAEWGWWILFVVKRQNRKQRIYSLSSLIIVMLLSLPMLIYKFFSNSLHGLSWIEAPTWADAIGIISDISSGYLWTGLLFTPAIAIYLLDITGLRRLKWLHPACSYDELTVDPCTFIMVWFLSVWGGLLAISWVWQPAMIARYALPAGVAAMLIPLIIAERIRVTSSLWIACFFVILSFPQWSQRGQEVMPGFRELTQFLQTNVDPQKGAVVHVIDVGSEPEWEKMELLGYDYYSLRDREIYKIHADQLRDGGGKGIEILHDPRALYLVVFRSDPKAIINNTNRQLESFHLEGRSYSQLLFQPYRLVKIAAIE